jgi:hypothetical protein
MLLKRQTPFLSANRTFDLTGVQFIAPIMQVIGAKLTDIQKLLLYSNAATTGLYLETITRGQNQFIGKFTALLGVSGMMAKLFAVGSEE